LQWEERKTEKFSLTGVVRSKIFKAGRIGKGEGTRNESQKSKTEKEQLSAKGWFEGKHLEGGRVKVLGDPNLVQS